MNKQIKREIPQNAEHENKKSIPVWKRQFYLLGALPEDELEALRALERDDEDVRGQIAAQRALNEEIMAKYPPPAEIAAKYAEARANNLFTPPLGKPVLPDFLRKLAGVRDSANSWNWNVFSRWAIPAFVCAAALVYLPMRLFSPATISVTETAHNAAVGHEVNGIRAKGLTPTIEVWQKSGNRAEKLSPGAIVRARDIVQLGYAVPEPCYGAIVSLDGRGVLTVHLSGDSGNAVPLASGRTVALSSAYRLDDAPLFETFYLITAPDNFDVNATAESLKNAEFSTDEDGVKWLGNRQITEFTLLKSLDTASKEILKK